MSLQITKQGLLDSMQDGGRFGYQHLGIGPSGAMDLLAAKLANIFVNNEMDEAVIEMHFPAPTILIQEKCLLMITGADFGAQLNAQSISLHQPFVAEAGTILSFSKYAAGARCYLAVHGGFAIDEWLHSKSTHVKVKAGGFHGRNLCKNDIVPFRQQTQPTPLSSKTFQQDELHSWIKENYAKNKIALIKGQAFDALCEAAKSKLLNQEFIISSQSDRMGFRLLGEPIPVSSATEILSTAVTNGTIQLLPSGQLIILMADHQTTGGYPIVAHVASYAIPCLAQKRINEKISFEMISLEKATSLFVQQQNELSQWKKYFSSC